MESCKWKSYWQCSEMLGFLQFRFAQQSYVSMHSGIFPSGLCYGIGSLSEIHDPLNASFEDSRANHLSKAMKVFLCRKVFLRWKPNTAPPRMIPTFWSSAMAVTYEGGKRRPSPSAPTCEHQPLQQQTAASEDQGMWTDISPEAEAEAWALSSGIQRQWMFFLPNL